MVRRPHLWPPYKDERRVTVAESLVEWGKVVKKEERVMSVVLYPEHAKPVEMPETGVYQQKPQLEAK